MANSKVVFEVIATGKGFKVVAQDINKTSKATDNLDKSQKKATKSAGGYDKQNKALYQSNLSSAKSFSKMNQTIGGSGGSGALVASYAVLAANVFAVSAAFNTLRGAAASEKLAEGLVAFSNSSGQSLDIVARKLQETTGHAVSFDMAMRTAALSTSAGFGVAEMEGLTRVAKGASLALGRDMGDALDRLTRGAIKLEPEILDELGIMVRLDDATENYAATLNKSATQLTRFERQQAFMNAIITEGETKFGAIADSIDPNSYDQLSAAFADLAKAALALLNGALIPIINFMISSPSIFLGAVAMFSGGIAKRMIPALGDMSGRSLEAAQNAQKAVKETLKSSQAMAAGAEQAIGPIKGLNSNYEKLVDGFKGGNRTTKQLSNMKRSLSASINGLTKKMAKNTAEGVKQTRGDKTKLASMVTQRQALNNLTTGRAADISMIQLELQMSNAYVAAKTGESQVIALASTQVFTYSEALALSMAVGKGVILTTIQYIRAQYAAITSTTALNFMTKAFRLTLATLKGAFFGAGLAAKGFGTALLNMIPFIGTIIMIAGIAISMLKGMLKWFGIGTDEQKAFKDSMKDLGVILDGIPDKMGELIKQQERAGHTTQVMINRYKVLGGLIKTVTDAAIEAERLGQDAGQYKSFFGGEKDIMKEGVNVGGNPMMALSASDVAKQAENISPMIKAIRNLNEESEDFAQFAKNKLGKSLDEFISELNTGGNSVQEISNQMRILLIDGEGALNGVSQAAEGMSRNFAEAEKVTQKFFRGITKTTPFDTISVSFKTLSNNLASVVKEAEEAGESPLAFIGEAALKMGKGMTKLMGPELVNAMKVSRDIQAEITKDQLTLIQTTEKKARDELKKRIALLQGDFKKANMEIAEIVQVQLPATGALLDNLIQRTHLTKKENKFLKERKTAMLSIAKNGHTILAAKKIENAMAIKQIALLRLEIELKKGAVREAEQAQAAGRELNKEQRATLNNTKDMLIQIATLENTITDERVDQAKSFVALLKDQQDFVKSQKELSNILASNEEKFQKIFSAGAGLDFTKIKAANVELSNAELKYGLVVKESNIRITLLNAEFSLLEAQQAVEKQKNNKRIAELQQMKLVDAKLRARKKVLEDIQPRDLTMGDKIHNMNIKSNPAGAARLGHVKRTRFEGRTSAEETELNNINASIRGDFDSDIASLVSLNDAISKTATFQLESLELTQSKTAQSIIEAALDAQLTINSALGDLGEGFMQSGGGLGMASAIKAALSPSQLSVVRDDLKTKIDAMMTKKDDMGLTTAEISQLDNWNDAYAELVERTKGKNFELANSFAQMGNVISGIFGEEGAMLSGMMNLSATMVTSFDTMKGGFTGLKDTVDAEGNVIMTKNEQIADKLNAVGNIIGQIGQLAATSAKQKVAGVDREIAAEKKKDGKSKESLAKIVALEKKKEGIERKAFERNKKIQMAQILINTAAGIMKTIGETGFFGLPLALIIGAMGAAQLSMVAGTSFQGGGSAATVSAPSSIEVGKRDNKVDVSKGASSGETAYLRGQTGMGRNANNFTPGAAAGMKSYASGGDVLVGERGPEIISPLGPMEVTPNDKIGGTSNVNFTINAVDAEGVQSLLQRQRGNIIGMIREAAHEHGEEFMEPVNIEAY